MWVNRKIEKLLHEKLEAQLGEAEGEKYFGFYTTARQKLIDNVLEEIKAIIPNLSDHGPRHIANVLDNAERLLSNDIERYSGVELYCLCLSILFHDVGNIYGREKHNKKVTQIYNLVRSSDPSFLQERYIITKIAEAHSGRGKENTTDTLGDVIPVYHLDGLEVRMQELAAILRLADELAEGLQRTSLFWNLIDSAHYPSESKIYHTYASIFSVHIDAGNSRISLSYNIELQELSKENFDELMQFVYKRIVKLDEERKYCKFYNDVLNKFKAVNAQFNFTKEGNHLDIGLDSIILNDMQKPGELSRKIEEVNIAYDIPNLWDKLNQMSATLEA